jgi:hypothetical protein
MRRWVLGAAVILFCASPLQAGGYYKYLYVAKRDGNVKIWRTKDGVRVSPTPAADIDVVAGDSVWVHGDEEWCNDIDIKWTNASAQPKSNFVGHAYAFPRFEDFLGIHPGPMPHVQLADVTGIEIDQDLALEFWWENLQSNPPPDPLSTYEFINGSCIDLPGYLVSETASGVAFTGICEVIGEGDLFLESEAVPVLSRDGVLALVALLLLAGGVVLGRRSHRSGRMELG